VEDEPLLRGLIAHFLRGEDFEIVEAEDGREAVERFSDMGPFDLVLLDLNLPVFSGVEVCRLIKQERPDQVVIICSAAILDGHVAALSALDVDNFLTKPYHPAELLSRISIELSKRRHDLPITRAGSSTRRSDQGHVHSTPSHALVNQSAID
jgi:DNA-binding response OmpR family regulator